MLPEPIRGDFSHFIGNALTSPCASSLLVAIFHRYFKQTKLASFQRQVNLYGFSKVSAGLDKGAYYHPLFLRGRPELCELMVRTTNVVKGEHCAQSKGENSAQAVGEQTMQSTILGLDIDFYSLPFCPPGVCRDLFTDSKSTLYRRLLPEHLDALR